MNKLTIIASTIIALLLLACSSDYTKLEQAISNGDLKEAEEYLKEVNDIQDSYYYGGMLIDEYLAIGKIDRAIYVFDNITGHQSMYEFGGEYTPKYASKIYTALIDAERYDDAWNYHKRSYDTVDYPGNAPDYLAYLTDVIISMCNNGHKDKVPAFIKEKSTWFLKNVDNHQWGKDYPNFSYDIMRSELNRVFDDIQNQTMSYE